MLLVRQTTSNGRPAINEEIEEFDWETEEVEGQPYLPSPWEIERCCREIRRGWSESEYRKRAGQRIEPLEIATIPCRISLFDLGPLDFS